MTTESGAAVASPEAASQATFVGRWTPRLHLPAVALFFTIAAIVQTWPLAKHPKDSLTTWWFFPFDAWQFLWNLWWVKHSVLSLENPFHTELLMYPQGSDLYLHPVTFISGVISIPIQLLTGDIILSWNLLALLSFVLAGVGAYALAYRVTSNRLAALVAGFIFAFTPFTLMRFGGHWNIFATWPIPFLLLFLVRFAESHRKRDAMGAGVLWAIVTLNWLEFASDAAVFLALFIGYWTLVYLIRRERRELKQLWQGAAIIIVVWVVLSSPYLIGAIENIESGDYFQPGGDESFSADLLAYVTPSPLWGHGDAPSVGGSNPLHQASLKTIEGTAYLGILPLLLAGAALFTARKNPHRVLPWVIGFLAFAILALGPHLWINNETDLSLLGVSFKVPLPYQIYDELPFLGNRRVPARMIVFGIMALSVLSAIGLDLLMSRFKGRLRLAAPVLALIALAVVWGEYWSPPIYIERMSSPAVFDQIRREDGDFSVLHLPLGRRTGWTFAGDPTGAALVMYYQPLHEKATIGGYLSRVSDKEFTWFLEQPGLRYLSCPSCPDPPTAEDTDRRAVTKVFADNKIRYVVVHRIGPGGNAVAYVGEREVQIMDSYLRDIVGFEPMYSDEDLTVYSDASRDE